MGGALITFIIHYLYLLALEKRMDREGALLRGQKNTPELYINYVPVNRFEDESRKVMKQIMINIRRKRHKQCTRQLTGSIARI